MFGYANPRRFMKLSGALLPWLVALTLILLGAGLYLALIHSPPDFKQSETVRIMYIHVPSAWMSMFIYGVIGVSSLFSLIWRHQLADLAAKASAPLGAGFTFITLVTGSLWGKPMWGTWWVWDARLTSELILLFIYLGYMALWEAIDDKMKAAQAAAILGLVGVLILPIIHFSVDWWNTLHQPASVARLDGPSIDSSILVPLLVMALAFKAYYVTLLLIRMRGEVRAQRVRGMLRRATDQVDRAPTDGRPAAA